MSNPGDNPFEIFAIIMGFLIFSTATMALVEGSTWSDENHCGQRVLSEITGEPLEDVLWEVGYGRTYSYDLWVYLRHHGYPNATYGSGFNEDADIYLRENHWTNSEDFSGWTRYLVRGWVKLN